jgi:hypothetical protein
MLTIFPIATARVLVRNSCHGSPDWRRRIRGGARGLAVLSTRTRYIGCDLCGGIMCRRAADQCGLRKPG